MNGGTDHYAATIGPAVVFRRSPQLVARGDVLSRLRLNYETLPEHRLVMGRWRWQLLVADDPQALAEDEVAAIRGWPAAGGRMLLTGDRFASRCGAGANRVRLAKPLAESDPAEVADAINGALPPAGRALAADAPPHIEAVLRRRNGSLVEHLVNRGQGRREQFDVPAGGARVRITGIEPAPATHLSARRGGRPRAVTIGPGGRPLKGWSYQAGRLEAGRPPFDSHLMAAVRPA